MSVDFASFYPLYQEDEVSIRARMDADVNAGVDPTSDEWTDNRQGAVYFINSQPTVIEIGRVWDAISVEVPAAAFIASAWGEYLDYHAEDLGLERKTANFAVGTVLFKGIEGSLVPANVTLTSLQTDPNVEPPEYVTTEDGELSAELNEISDLAGTPSTSSGSLAAGTYHYQVTAFNEYGETLGSNDIAVVLSGIGRITLGWTAIPEAVAYGIYRGPTSGGEFYMRQVTSVGYVDTGVDSVSTTPLPAANTTSGQLRLAVRAVEAGGASNVGIGAINQMRNPVGGVIEVTNDVPITEGSDIEDDELLRERCQLEFQGGGSGNIADYKSWALAYPGVGSVTVIPLISGPGTVGVIIGDVNNDPVGQDTVDGLQNELDPLSAQGAGVAPIDHNVLVSTPAQVAITVVASGIVFDAGYSLDGDTGIALRDTINAAVADYVNNLKAGDDVVFDHVKSRFYAVPGVHKVTTLTVNGGTSDIAVATGPPAQIAELVLPLTLS